MGGFFNFATVKNYILKRSPVLHLACLLIIAVSVFMKQLDVKFALLASGIAGLMLIYFFTGKKLISLILLLLLAIAAVVYMKMTGTIELKNPFG